MSEMPAKILKGRETFFGSSVFLEKRMVEWLAARRR